MLYRFVPNSSETVKLLQNCFGIKINCDLNCTENENIKLSIVFSAICYFMSQLSYRNMRTFATEREGVKGNPLGC